MPKTPIRQTPLTGTQLLRLASVMTVTGLCRSGLYGLIRQGRFPAPIKISKQASAWVASEVDEWVRERIATRERAS